MVSINEGSGSHALGYEEMVRVKCDVGDGESPDGGGLRSEARRGQVVEVGGAAPRWRERGAHRWQGEMMRQVGECG